MDVQIINIEGRRICIGGIGKLFYQDGLPIGMCVNALATKGIEVSYFHIADECLKNGWSPETTTRKLHDEFTDTGITYDKDRLYLFCNTSYENQRKMIFDFLFPNTEVAKNWFVQEWLFKIL